MKPRARAHWEALAESGRVARALGWRWSSHSKLVDCAGMSSSQLSVRQLERGYGWVTKGELVSEGEQEWLLIVG